MADVKRQECNYDPGHIDLFIQKHARMEIQFTSACSKNFELAPFSNLSIMLLV